MGTYDGEWKRVDGETFYIVVKESMLFRKVLLRDGKYEHNDDTLMSTKSCKLRNKTLEKQVMKTIDKHMSEKRSKERQIDRAVEKMDEVYGSDW
jgi:hypothetical protein